MVFADMSARDVGLKELWVLKWNKLYNTRCAIPGAVWPEWMDDFTDYGTPTSAAAK